MGEGNTALKAKNQENMEQLKSYRLMDDDFMTVVFRSSACAELLLRIILNNYELHVIDVQTQEYKKNLEGRSAVLDIYASDDKGRKYDVEVQRSDLGAGFKRARYNGSLMDASVTEPGTKFENLPDVYVIFITENDIIGENLPIYHFQQNCIETNEAIDDGKYTIYVNSRIQDNTALGKLMHDFWCTDANDMNYSVLAERVRYFKETEEGIRTMSRVMEERLDGITIEYIKNLMKNLKMTAEQALDALGIQHDERERLLPKLNAQ